MNSKGKGEEKRSALCTRHKAILHSFGSCLLTSTFLSNINEQCCMNIEYVHCTLRLEWRTPHNRARNLIWEERKLHGKESIVRAKDICWESVPHSNSISRHFSFLLSNPRTKHKNEKKW